MGSPFYTRGDSRIEFDSPPGIWVQFTYLSDVLHCATQVRAGRRELAGSKAALLGWPMLSPLVRYSPTFVRGRFYVGYWNY